MNAAHAYYLLPVLHPLALKQLAYGKAKAERRKAIFANLPGFLAKYNLADFYRVDACEISRDNGACVALVAQSKYGPHNRPHGWSETGRPHRTKKYEQMRNDFRAISTTVDVPENPMPSMSEPLLFAQGRCFFPMLIDIGDSVVLSWPYDEDKQEAPVDLPDGVTERDRIPRSKYIAMIEEHNSAVREEKAGK